MFNRKDIDSIRVDFPLVFGGGGYLHHDGSKPWRGNFNHPKLGALIFMVLDIQGYMVS